MADNTCDRKCCLSWQMMLPMSHFIIAYTKKSYMCLITHTSLGRNKVNVTRKHTVARNERKGSRIMHNVWLNPKHNFSHLLGWPRSFKNVFVYCQACWLIPVILSTVIPVLRRTVMSYRLVYATEPDCFKANNQPTTQTSKQETLETVQQIKCMSCKCKGHIWTSVHA